MLLELTCEVNSSICSLLTSEFYGAHAWVQLSVQLINVTLFWFLVFGNIIYVLWNCFSLYVRVVVFFGVISVIKGSSILSMRTSVNFKLHDHWLSITFIMVWNVADCGVGSSCSKSSYTWDSFHSLHTFSNVRWPENLVFVLKSRCWESQEVFVKLLMSRSSAGREANLPLF